MPRDEMWDGLKEQGKQVRAERVAKNPERIAYAIKQLEKHDIEYALKSEVVGHFHCRRKSDDVLYQFWAGTGKIMGPDVSGRRGIHALIKMLMEVPDNV